jgi:hypothetical protein
LAKSRLPERKLEGIRKRVSFLEKKPKELAKEPPSWKKAGRNSQKSQLPGKEPEGIHKRAAWVLKFISFFHKTKCIQTRSSCQNRSKIRKTARQDRISLASIAWLLLPLIHGVWSRRRGPTHITAMFVLFQSASLGQF